MKKTIEASPLTPERKKVLDQYEAFLQSESDPDAAFNATVDFICRSFLNKEIPHFRANISALCRKHFPSEIQRTYEWHMFDVGLVVMGFDDDKLLEQVLAIIQPLKTLASSIGDSESESLR